MAACQLHIQLDDPHRLYSGGESISGRVIVNCANDVTCNGLKVTTKWTTHGRGNSARGEVESRRVFAGNWLAGQTYEYPFTLTTATWPPTYYGHYLNVSHLVEAEADIPWAVDPSTSEEFRVEAKSSPSDLAPTNTGAKASPFIGWIVGIIFLAIFGIAFIPLLIFLAPVLAVGFGIYWFFFKFLPKRVTGDVVFEVDSATLDQGQTLKGRCEFTPKRDSQINGVVWTVQCQEVVVSGSGSNRTTSRHDAVKEQHHLLPATQLKAGQTQRFELLFSLPSGAPPSMEFTDNKIIWTHELRVDIPGWPDWSKTLPLTVRVSPAVHPAQMPTASNDPDSITLIQDDDPWFTEVLQQVVASHTDPDRLDLVLEAVEDQLFPIVVDTQAITDEPLDADIEEEDEDEGAWLTATDSRNRIRLVLFIPSNMDVQAIQWTRRWKNVARVIGYDSDTDRIILRVPSPIVTTQDAQPLEP